MPPGRPLTVLQVIPTLETGGAERTTIDIAAALVKRGDHALVASAGGRLASELTEIGATLFDVPVGAKNPYDLGLNVLRIGGLIKEFGIDVVHARSRAPAWAARLACRRAGIPFVTTFHGSYAERNALKRFYNSVMASGDVVIANSHYTADLIAQRYGAEPERIVVIQRGTDLARFSAEAVSDERRNALRREWGLEAGERIVLNLARLTGWKGQSVLIEAASLPQLSAHGDVVVVLAGDAQGRDTYRQTLERSIATHDLNGRLRIVGHCADAPAALALADVAIIASTEPEAFGRTAVEAAALGVPVVATALGATAETVLAPPACAADQRTGWLVPSGDAAALADGIHAALALSPGERQALAGRARTHAMRFSVEAMQQATLAVYDRLTGRGSA